MSIPPTELPPVDLRRLGTVTVATLLDKRLLGARAAAAFDEHLFPVADGLGGDGLVVNFARVTYFGSDSFGRLIELAARVERAHGWLTLCHIDPRIEQVFRITRLDTKFDIADDLETAIGSGRPTDPA